MSIGASVAAFVLAATLLTVTPGLDTMLVLRTAATEGRRPALLAACGIGLGCLAWGAAVALGLGVLLAASALAYAMLTWAGAAYLVWIGLALLWRPRRTIDAGEAAAATIVPRSGRLWLRRGFLTNLLNPKIGIFYVSFLPQFVPPGTPPALFIFALATCHVAIGIAWLSLLAMGMARLGPLLRRPRVVAWLDRITGVVFVGFGLKLALRPH